ncbi:MAG TPA: hypothetical protein VEZ12_06940, partial [Herpetosiphonaceae bacterium]|nr:hypothetical protein [Herpetosiphonaceae bacterium]
EIDADDFAEHAGIDTLLIVVRNSHGIGSGLVAVMAPIVVVPVTRTVSNYRCSPDVVNSGKSAGATGDVTIVLVSL